MAVELSYCVVNTGRRQLLHYCLDAIARERATVAFETEVIVLDNGSGDGSAEAARTHPVTTEVIALDRAQPLGANVAGLLARARGRYCLLLDEDSELEPGATAALHVELDRLPRAGATCATLVDTDGTPRDSAWRLGASVRGGRGGVRRVSWARTAAMLVRRDAAAQAGSFDPTLSGRTAERDFCRRLRRAGYRLLLVPDARAVVHDGVS
jgi:N-acetylglucosaminyl-diphospho-decaprenol L-rhamnosyltransferase